MSISLVGTATAAGTSVTVPSHQAGDLILIVAFNGSNGVTPSLSGSPAYTNVKADSTNVAMRVGYRIATSTSDTSGTWTSATHMLCLVYRPDASHVIGIGAFTSNTGSSNTVTFGGLTLTNTSGSSWVVGAIGHKSSDQNLSLHPPTGMTNEADLTIAAMSPEAAVHDTNGGVSSWSSQTVTLSGTSGSWVTIVAEILLTAVTVNNLTLNVTGSASFALLRGTGAFRSVLSSSLITVVRSIAKSALSSVLSAGFIGLQKSATKLLSMSSSGSVKQITRQWLKALSFIESSTVSMWSKQISRNPALSAASIVQRMSTIAITERFSSSNLISQFRTSSKALSIVAGQSSVHLTRSVGKILVFVSVSTLVLSFLKFRVIVLSVTAASTLSILRQTSRSLSATATSFLSVQRAISHTVPAFGSSSVVFSSLRTNLIRSMSSTSLASLARSWIHVIRLSSNALLTSSKSIARTISLSIIGSSLVGTRRSISHALRIAGAGLVNLIRGAGVHVALIVISAATVHSALSTLIRRSLTSTNGIVISRSTQIRRLVLSAPTINSRSAISKSLTAIGAVRVSILQLDNIKRYINKFLFVVGRATRYLIIGRAALVVGRAMKIVQGSTSMNSHEPLDFVCGFDWQMGGPLLNSDNTPMSLSGASITWKLDSIDGGTNFITLNSSPDVVVVDLPSATIQVNVPFTETQSLSPGSYRDYLIVTLAGGQKIPMWTGIIRAGGAPA